MRGVCKGCDTERSVLRERREMLISSVGKWIMISHWKHGLREGGRERDAMGRQEEILIGIMLYSR